MLQVVFTVTRSLGFVLATDEDVLDTSYVFATGIFLEGSIIFLAFAATNQEVLTAMRVRYFLTNGDNEKVVYNENERNYTESLDAERQNQQAEYVRHKKMDAINSLFLMAQQVDRVEPRPSKKLRKT
ncbi:uncharacterized protein LOC144450430 [Glandiceps talaboti]